MTNTNVEINHESANENCGQMHVTLPVPLGPGTYMVGASCCPQALEVGRQVTFLQSLQDGVAGGGGAHFLRPIFQLWVF